MVVMRGIKLLRYFVFAALLALYPCLGGCIVICTQRMVTASVHDAETDAPIPNAQLNVVYVFKPNVFCPFGDYGWQPKAIDGRTDEHGTALLQITNWEQNDWSASADGYLSYRMFTDSSVRGTMDIRLYREPEPKITIVLPNGYLGWFRAEWRHVPTTPPRQIGKRDFVFRSSPAGYVCIDATPALDACRQTSQVAISAAYEDGRVIPHADGRLSPDVVCWDTQFGDGDHRMCFVGTGREQSETLKRLVTERNKERDRSAWFDRWFNAPSTRPATSCK